MNIRLCYFLTVSALFGIVFMKVPPRDIGFNCDDPDIQHPRYDDTVTPLHLVAIGLGAPVIAVSHIVL